MLSSSKHLAVVLPAPRSRLVVQERATPVPGPDEVLIQVKAIALNPIDHVQRRLGFPTLRYPAIIGSDVAGEVLAVGGAVAAAALRPGARVAAYAPSFFVKGRPDYGAFQQRVLVPAENVVPLPEGIGFDEASTLPMAAQTAWSGWLQAGMARDRNIVATKGRGVLVWGAGGSVGSAALQIAKIAGYRVYATASAKNHAYLQGLGAHRIFDYRDADVVSRLVGAAREDGVSVDMGYLASGQPTPCTEVLRALKTGPTSKLAMAPFHPSMLLWKIFPTWRKTEVKFVAPPADEQARRSFFRFVFTTWLKEQLAAGSYVPSPKVQVVPGGLQAIEQALEEFKRGLSAVKLVVKP